MSTVIVYDATHDEAPNLPRGGRAAGYTTGSGGIAWSAADWAAHPGAVRIDQDPAASDHTADILDVESGAATFSDCAPWVRSASANFRMSTRPGQRMPAIYASESNMGQVAAALNNGGVRAGLWVANWSLTLSEAGAMIGTTLHGFPVIGVQYQNDPSFDVSVFDLAWLDNVSGQTPAGNEETEMAMLENGPGALTVIALKDSDTYVRFVADNGLQQLQAATLRVAMSGETGAGWSVDPHTVDSKVGALTIHLPAGTHRMSVRREDAGDVVVGYVAG